MKIRIDSDWLSQEDASDMLAMLIDTSSVLANSSWVGKKVHLDFDLQYEESDPSSDPDYEAGLIGQVIEANGHWLHVYWSRDGGETFTDIQNVDVWMVTLLM